MKFKVIMKSADALQDAIERAIVDAFMKREVDSQNMNEEEEAEFDALAVEAGKKASKWFKYGELIALEVDTENNTCIVLPASEI